MYSKTVSLTLLALLLSLFTFASSAHAAPFALGDGTVADPYQITTCGALQVIGNNESLLSKSYLLATDLNCADTTDFVPIGNADTSFTGTFDGAGHTISHLTMNYPDSNYVGLFGIMSGSVYNLTLDSPSIVGSQFVGALAGEVFRNTSLTNVKVTGGLVTANHNYAGALTGEANRATVTNCSASTSVTVFGMLGGGLIGSASLSTITQSFATGDVSSLSSGNAYIGGLIGDLSNSTLSESYATGTISDPTGAVLGGLLGASAGSSVSNTYASGTVSGSSHVGGLIGVNYSRLLASVNNSYSSGSVRGDDYVGGLIGQNDGDDINNCFTTSSISPMTSFSDLTFVAGFVGSDHDSNPTLYTNNFWNNNFSWGATDNNGEPMTSAGLQLASLAVFKGNSIYGPFAAWAFSGDDQIWQVNANAYPTLGKSSAVAQVQNNNSNNNTPPSSTDTPVCTDSAPLFAPDLFEIDAAKATAKLFFAPLPDTNHFYISFSTHPNAQEHGADVTLAREGVQNFTVNFLQPNTTYYFKVRGQNGCATGPWSQILKAKTGATKKFYRVSPFLSL